MVQSRQGRHDSLRIWLIRLSTGYMPLPCYNSFIKYIPGNSCVTVLELRGIGQHQFLESPNSIEPRTYKQLVKYSDRQERELWRTRDHTRKGRFNGGISITEENHRVSSSLVHRSHLLNLPSPLSIIELIDADAIGPNVQGPRLISQMSQCTFEAGRDAERLAID